MDLAQTATSENIIHSIWLTMLITGILGGILAWYREQHNDKTSTQNLIAHCISGILATFMVPLFLQMIGSSLLKDLAPEYHQFYVFIGFCSAAAYISQTFANKVSERMMQDTQQKAQGAIQKVHRGLARKAAMNQSLLTAHQPITSTSSRFVAF